MKKIDLEEIRTLQIYMLQYIDAICTKNEIKYSLIGGSLIGAIRHNGFIPWDDDIDIGMTLENYLKFEKAMNTETNSNYTLMSYETNHEYYYPFNKLVDNRTVLHEKGLKDIKNYGIYVDIFIYSGLPNDIRKRKKHYKKIRRVNSLLAIYAKNDMKTNSFIKTILKKIVKRIIETVGISKVIKYSYKLREKYDINTSEYAMHNWPIYKFEGEVKKAKILEEVENHQFENIQAKIVKQYDEFLKGTFGDYMKLPPEEERHPSHGLEAFWR